MNPSNSLFKTFDAILKKREARSARRRLTIAAEDSVDFSSNDFLSLSKSSALRAAYLDELASAAHIPLGSTASRLLDGNSVYYENLERDLAEFYRAPSGLLFNSGFDANTGFFSCVPQPGDIIVYDELIHASVHEGMRLSRSKLRKPFAHNDIEDFESVLKSLVSNDESLSSGSNNLFVTVETVYSMDGDVAPVQQILDCLEQHLPLGNGHLVVDEAHATGVYGPSGRGLICELGIEDRLLARLHTFGKALSSGGAILLCPPIVRDYLINYARSLIYTTALGLPTLAMIKTTHNFMRDGATNEVQQRLWNLMDYFYSGLQALPDTPFLIIPKEAPSSSIFSLRTPDPRDLARKAQEKGFIIRPIMPPTVPHGKQRVRVCLHSGNTKAEVDGLLRLIETWVRSQSQQSSVEPTQLIERSRL